MGINRLGPKPKRMRRVSNFGVAQQGTKQESQFPGNQPEKNYMLMRISDNEAILTVGW